MVEGLNTKVKLTTRKSYGFKIYKCAEIALYHSLGRLPTPEMTHRFY
ncbi:MAG: transposase [Lentisphaeria bacterium]